MRRVRAHRCLVHASVGAVGLPRPSPSPTLFSPAARAAEGAYGQAAGARCRLRRRLGANPNSSPSHLHVLLRHVARRRVQAAVCAVGWRLTLTLALPSPSPSTALSPPVTSRLLFVLLMRRVRAHRCLVHASVGAVGLPRPSPSPTLFSPAAPYLALPTCSCCCGIWPGGGCKLPSAPSAGGAAPKVRCDPA